MEINTRYLNTEMTLSRVQSPQAKPVDSGTSQATSDKVTLSDEAQALLAADNTFKAPEITPMNAGGLTPPPFPPPPPPPPEEKDN